MSGFLLCRVRVESGGLIRTIHNNTLQICPPFVTAEDEVSLVAETITGVLDTYAHAPIGNLGRVARAPFPQPSSDVVTA
jgi:hypothetical protein